MKLSLLPILAAPGLLELIHRSNSVRLRETVILQTSSLAFTISRQKRDLCIRALNQFYKNRMNSREIRAVARGLFQTFWRDLFETTYFEWEVDQIRRIEVVGLERLERAIDKQQGCILWESNSFGRRNLAKQVLAFRGYGLEQVHLQDHLLGLGRLQPLPPWVVRYAGNGLLKWEYRFVNKIHEIPRSGGLSFTRDLLRGLNENRIICSAGDGPQGQKHSAVPFLGGILKVATGMLSLARISGAPILPLVCYKRKTGCYIVELCEAVPMEKYASREIANRQGAEHLARVFEEKSLQYPDQRCSWVTQTEG